MAEIILFSEKRRTIEIIPIGLNLSLIGCSTKFHICLEANDEKESYSTISEEKGQYPLIASDNATLLVRI